MSQSGAPRGSEALVLFPAPAEHGAPLPLSLVKFLGRSALQRTLYTLAHSAIRECALWYPGDCGTALQKEIDAQIEEVDTGNMVVNRIAAPRIDPSAHKLAEEVIVVQANFVFDDRVMTGLLEHGIPAALCAPDGEVLGLARLSRETAQELTSKHTVKEQIEAFENLPGFSTGSVPQYVPGMRRKFAPYWQFLEQDSDLDAASAKVMDSAQKGVLDFPARYLHPVPENFLARLASATSITPNQITILSAVLAFVGTYWFAVQNFLPALLIAVTAGVLDGVDGKLARIKLMSSPFGDRLDHSLDMSFEFSWYVALGWGLYGWTGDWSLFVCGIGLVGIMVVARGFSGLYLFQTGHQIHDHTAFDRVIRLFAGRRNIYVVVLLAGYLSGNLVNSFYIVIIWGLATMVVYALRNVVVFVQGIRPA